MVASKVVEKKVPSLSRWSRSLCAPPPSLADADGFLCVLTAVRDQLQGQERAGAQRRAGQRGGEAQELVRHGGESQAPLRALPSLVLTLLFSSLLKAETAARLLRSFNWNREKVRLPALARVGALEIDVACAFLTLSADGEVHGGAGNVPLAGRSGRRSAWHARPLARTHAPRESNPRSIRLDVQAQAARRRPPLARTNALDPIHALAPLGLVPYPITNRREDAPTGAESKGRGVFVPDLLPRLRAGRGGLVDFCALVRPPGVHRLLDDLPRVQDPGRRGEREDRVHGERVRQNRWREDC